MFLLLEEHRLRIGMAAELPEKLDVKATIKKALIDFGCPYPVVVRGLIGLVANWEIFSNQLKDGERFSLDYYVNCLEIRTLLFLIERDISKRADAGEILKFQERIAVADKDYQAATINSREDSHAESSEEISWLFKRVAKFVAKDQIANWEKAITKVGRYCSVSKRRLAAKRRSAFDSGAKRAAAGGDFESNPHRDGEPLVFMAWIRGFRSRQTFNPACSICNGTGRRKLGQTCSDPKSNSSPYDGAEISCDCNVESPT